MRGNGDCGAASVAERPNRRRNRSKLFCIKKTDLLPRTDSSMSLSANSPQWALSVARADLGRDAVWVRSLTEGQKYLTVDTVDNRAGQASNGIRTSPNAPAILWPQRSRPSMGCATIPLGCSQQSRPAPWPHLSERRNVGRGELQRSRGNVEARTP